MIAPLALTALAAVVVATPFPSVQRLHLMDHVRGNAAVAPATAHLTNYGGPVIPNVQVQPIFYGAANYQAQTNAFYAGVTQSSWYDSMAQYGVYRGSASPGISVSATKSALDDVTDVQALLISLVKAGTIVPTANTYFPIHFAPGISITQGGSGSCKVFCAYHGTIDISSLNKGTKYLFYGVMPDQGGSCAGGCGSNPSQVNNMFSVASHELAEAVTDAAVGLATAIAAPLAWYDATNGENGDICNAQQGTTVGGDGVSYVVQKIWSNADNACVQGATGGQTTTTTKKATTSTTTTTTKGGVTTKATTTTTTTKGGVTTTKAAGGNTAGAPCTNYGAWACSNSLICSYGSNGLVWVQVGSVSSC
ncbi:UNVERIFIED_CONTAM: hypothetical protein HDU68_012093 [Siphonaria sp. JEL0065]|nr:hypothetical protein HDU68_012093 [Siphonaria sp. JEL0065]